MNDWLTTRPIAHRGLHNNLEIPENSLSSFKAAMDRDFPIEMDIQRLADGTLIVHHDNTFQRMLGISKKVSEVNYSEIESLKLLDTEKHIPRFSEVLKLINGKVPLLIELKCSFYSGELERSVCHQLKNYSGPFAIESFNPKSVLWFKRNAPDITRGMISGSMANTDLNLWQKALIKNLLLLPVVEPHFVAFEWRSLQLPIISLLRKFGTIPILAWTIKSTEEQDSCRNLCDNIIFESIVPTYTTPSQ